MTKHDSHVRFLFIPSTHDKNPTCQAFRCGLAAVWQISFGNEPATNHQPPLRELELCWPHAASWCATNLSHDQPSPPDPT